jgi:hypothetical protein
MAKKTSTLEDTTINRWYAKIDPHPAVEDQKKKVRGKPRGLLATLHKQRTLGVMLLALGRSKDALSVLDEAAAVARPSARSDGWAVASWCAALAYWIRERDGTPALEPLLKFASPPAHAAQALQPELWTKARFAKEIASHWRELELGAADDDDLAIDTMAFHLCEVVFLRELHVLAPVHAGKVSTRAVDDAIERALHSIEAKITSQTPRAGRRRRD